MQLKKSDLKLEHIVRFFGNFWHSIIEKVSNRIAKKTAIFFSIGVTILAIGYQGSIFSLFNFNITDPSVLIPLGTSTGLVVLMTTLLSTPVSVAFAVGLIFYLVFNQLI